MLIFKWKFVTKTSHGLYMLSAKCVKHLRMWIKEKAESFWFGVPMKQREQKNHLDDCCFRTIDLKGFNRHKNIDLS